MVCQLCRLSCSNAAATIDAFRVVAHIINSSAGLIIVLGVPGYAMRSVAQLHSCVAPSRLVVIAAVLWVFLPVGCVGKVNGDADNAF